MMSYQPSRWLERLAETLVPPASAEHALGDLAECSGSRGRYLANLLSILPRVIWSQIRRRYTIGGVCFNAALTGVVLTVSQAVSNAQLFDDQSAGLRLAVPWVIWVAGCALASAYGPPDKPRQWNSRIFWITIAATLGSGAAIGVPIVPLTIGIVLVITILVSLSMPWLKTMDPRAPVSIETLPEQARQFQQMIWWRNARESAAAFLVLTFNARDVWQADNRLAGAGHLLLVLGMLVVMGFLHLRAGSRAVPAAADTRTMLRFHTREIARQRDVLRAVPLWYLLPFVPGITVLAFSKTETLGAGALLGFSIVLGFFGAVWWLNLVAARWLDGQLRQVDALALAEDER
jgi:hypothetical protein